MAEIKWIKLTTDMFDNRKIKYLRRLPEGNNIVLIWVMLLTMAGRCNANGMIFLTENIPYDSKSLADELDFEENTVKLALQALERMNMVITDGDFFTIAGWAEHQNIEGMEKIREQNRKRVSEHRQRKKEALPPPKSNVTVTLRNATEGEEEIDKEGEEKEKEEKESPPSPLPQQIVDLFNEICVSFPSVQKLTVGREKEIKARLNTYTVDEFKTLFEMAESSAFLKGENNRNWTATFDWLIKDSNMAKVLEGNYNDKKQSQQGSFDTSDFFETALRNSYGGKTDGTSGKAD